MELTLDLAQSSGVDSGDWAIFWEWGGTIIREWL
jgi:hypothetical protein